MLAHHKYCLHNRKSYITTSLLLRKVAVIHLKFIANLLDENEINEDMLLALHPHGFLNFASSAS